MHAMSCHCIEETNIVWNHLNAKNSISIEQGRLGDRKIRANLLNSTLGGLMFTQITVQQDAAKHVLNSCSFNWLILCEYSLLICNILEGDLLAFSSTSSKLLCNCGFGSTNRYYSDVNDMTWCYFFYRGRVFADSKSRASY